MLEEGWKAGLTPLQIGQGTASRNREGLLHGQGAPPGSLMSKEEVQQWPLQDSFEMNGTA